MSYYPAPDSHIRKKVKVVLDLTNYVRRFHMKIGKIFLKNKHF